MSLGTNNPGNRRSAHAKLKHSLDTHARLTEDLEFQGLTHEQASARAYELVTGRKSSAMLNWSADELAAYSREMERVTAAGSNRPR